SLVVGRDMRTSAPAMLEAFVDGASGAGASVVDIGLASTPMAYYAIGSLGVDGGAQITASHNPGNYIGFKFRPKGAGPVSGDTGIKDIEKLVTSGKVDLKPRSGPVERKDLTAAYADHVLKFGQGIKKLKVIIDAGNGMAGHTVPKILERLPIDAERMFFEL